MCGKAYDPRLIVSWPWAELAVMGGTQAAKFWFKFKNQLSKTRKTNFRKEHQQLMEKSLRITPNKPKVNIPRQNLGRCHH